MHPRPLVPPLLILLVAGLSACWPESPPEAAEPAPTEVAEPAPEAAPAEPVDREACERFAAHGVEVGAHLQDGGDADLEGEALVQSIVEHCLEWELSREGYDCFMAASDLEAWKACDELE